ncbi:CDP-diacylglycerol--glycerol-3-phosphate 3-phosphatidyltransferase [Caloramator mitchellensis]|uniref:CDP-diacylglycerol--serine O-phosphatidyltransferase n=1 Tax=Caloramator mitchellensis TaxID=908809 RepID=A0A0R3JWQ1_CALMK|nr:CDP-diacylglycerol--serine O-phosphatidyltransferase [Caloramator mitchellensis]KRQ87990.1 CDP-diacylglycerol--glycerol-3-phosphate 3-phosphatidyltransferase [Caloramator mitchellensis]
MNAKISKSVIPNSFTFINLTFGMLSIIFTLNSRFQMSAIMIILAALMDRYDGRIARKFNASSQLGKELDSLCDLISFGVAPAILSWGNFLINLGIIGYIIVILFPIAGAYRLARFNVTQFNNCFIGIPITFAGFLVAIDNIITIANPHYFLSSIFMLFLSYLMVSHFKFKKV